MTNKEILHADLLDILFENRNKAYGAYALRKNYNHRLQWALGISLCLVISLSLLNITSKTPGKKDPVARVVTLVDPPSFKDPDPPKPKVEPRRRQVAYTDQIRIVPDNMKTQMPDLKDILTADISVKTSDGPVYSDTVQAKGLDTGDKGATDQKNNRIDVPFTHSEAQFPGGKEAFARFLTKYLRTPGELEAGEKKVVLVRFMVDADGTISKTEILQSDGEEYSREVIRVLSKMPKWIPAMQNGTKVTTWFTQPVSFIGVE